MIHPCIEAAQTGRETYQLPAKALSWQGKLSWCIGMYAAWRDESLLWSLFTARSSFTHGRRQFLCTYAMFTKDINPWASYSTGERNISWKMGINGIVGHACAVMQDSTLTPLLGQGFPGSMGPSGLPGVEGVTDPAQQQSRTGQMLQSVPVSTGTAVTCLLWKSSSPARCCLLAILIKTIIRFSPLHLTF